jgi:hypothetical protein
VFRRVLRARICGLCQPEAARRRQAKHARQKRSH